MSMRNALLFVIISFSLLIPSITKGQEVIIICGGESCYYYFPEPDVPSNNVITVGGGSDTYCPEEVPCELDQKPADSIDTDKWTCWYGAEAKTFLDEFNKCKKVCNWVQHSCYATDMCCDAGYSPTGSGSSGKVCAGTCSGSGCGIGGWYKTCCKDGVASGCSTIPLIQTCESGYTLVYGTSCPQPIVCGNGVVESGEQCDPLGAWKPFSSTDCIAGQCAFSVYKCGNDCKWAYQYPQSDSRCTISESWTCSDADTKKHVKTDCGVEYFDCTGSTPVCKDYGGNDVRCECTNECSPSGTEECSGSGYRTCGNYDADSCLEWSSVTNCQYGCTNGECNPAPAPTTCSDGTPYGSCSATKPKYCDNGNLVDRCSQCGCPSGYSCRSDGSCQLTAVCGNNIKEGTEECDGTDLAGQTCVSKGYASGTLSCSNCRFDTSRCSATLPAPTQPTQPTCSGNIALTLVPNPVVTSGSVTASAYGLSGCPVKVIEFRQNSCSGTFAASCTGDTGCQSTFTAPSAAGTYTYYACVDKNGDNDKTDAGESGSAPLTVIQSGGPSGGTPPPGTTYTLTVTKSGTGSGTVTSADGKINCGSTCSASYAPGASVALTATPASGSTFGGWSGACTGTGICSVVMTTFRSVTATFTSGGTTPPGTPTCVPNNNFRCDSGHVYWFDSCGIKGSIKENCGTLGCVGISCTPPGTPTCVPNNNFRCDSGHVYWFDSCGNKGSIKENCGTRGCTGTQCNPPGDGGGTPTTCSDGTSPRQCSSTKPKYCDSNLQLIDKCSECVCPSGYSCRGDGSCQLIGDGGGAPPGETPTLSADVTHSPASPTTADTVTITATASGGSGLKSLKIYVDYADKKTCTSSPCIYSSTYSAGDHAYYATAEDNAGKSANTAVKSFTVTSPQTTPGRIAVAGAVWNDADSDGVKDAGEANLEGLQIQIGGAPCTGLGSSDYQTRTVTTSSEPNNYRFLDVPFPELCAQYGSAVYDVRLTLPEGFAYTGGSSGCSGASGTALCQWYHYSSSGRYEYYFNIGVKQTSALSVSAVHSPQSPTTAHTVTITATAFPSFNLRNTKVYVDGTEKKQCTTSPCEYAATYTEGTHTYYATAENNAGNTANSGTKSLTVTSTCPPPNFCTDTDRGIYQCPSYFGSYEKGAPYYCEPLKSIWGQTPRKCCSPASCGRGECHGSLQISAYYDKNQNKVRDPGEDVIAGLPARLVGWQVAGDYGTTTFTTPLQSGYSYNGYVLADALQWEPVSGGTKIKSADKKSGEGACGCSNYGGGYTAYSAATCWTRDPCQLNVQTVEYEGGFQEDVCYGYGPWNNPQQGQQCWEEEIKKWPAEYWVVTLNVPGPAYPYQLISLDVPFRKPGELPILPAKVTGTIEYPAVASRAVRLITATPQGGTGTCAEKVTQTDSKGSTATGCPNVTKTMDVDFIVKASVEKAVGSSRCSGEAGATNYCTVSVPGATMAWDPFVQGWRGVLKTDTAACDSYMTLAASISMPAEGVSGAAKSDIYIGCTPRVVVEPLERRVVLGQKNTEAFSITIYDPRYVEGTSGKYSLRMEFLGNAEERDIARHTLGSFECKESPCPITGTASPTDSNIIKQIADKTIPPKKTILIKLSDIGAVRAGVYPLKFVAEASPGIEGEGTLMVYAEGLDEFAAWQLVFMAVIAALVVWLGLFRINKKMPRKSTCR